MVGENKWYTFDTISATTPRKGRPKDKKIQKPVVGYVPLSAAVLDILKTPISERRETETPNQTGPIVEITNIGDDSPADCVLYHKICNTIIPPKTFDISVAKLELMRCLYSKKAYKSQQNTHTPFDLCFEILGKLKISDANKFLVISNLEFVVTLIDGYGMSPNNIYFVDEGLENGSGIMSKKTFAAEELIPEENVFAFNQFNMGVGMKFDFVVGNPPFTEQSANSTNTSKLYDKISMRAVKLTKDGGITAMIVPSVFTNTASKFGSFLEDNGVCFVKNLGRKAFNIDMSCLYFLCKVGSVVDEIYVEQIDGTISTKTSIKGCFSNHNKPEKNLGSRWCRGRLNRNAFTPGLNEIVEVCGKHGEPVTIARIANDECTAKGIKKVVVNNVGAIDGFGQVKIAPKNAAICFSVVAITLNDDEEEEYMLQYLQSDFVTKLVSQVKTSTPNSKNCFEHIPDFKFTKPITLEMFEAAINGVQ